jgi:hypothetical protein
MRYFSIISLPDMGCGGFKIAFSASPMHAIMTTLAGTRRLASTFEENNFPLMKLKILFMARFHLSLMRIPGQTIEPEEI